MLSFFFCFLLIKRYKDRFFDTALKPQIRRLLSDILGPATAAEQQVGEESSAASGSEPPQKVPQTGLHAMYAELLAEDGQRGAAADINTTSSQITLFTYQSQLSQTTNSHLIFGRPMKAAFLLSHKQHDPIFVHLAQA